MGAACINKIFHKVVCQIFSLIFLEVFLQTGYESGNECKLELVPAGESVRMNQIRLFEPIDLIEDDWVALIPRKLKHAEEHLSGHLIIESIPPFIVSDLQ